jgi:signal transduction histidine kinase
MAKYDILLVGDGSNLLQTVSWVLEYKGFSVQTAATPEAALEALVRKNYDLVMARITSAYMDGLDILKRAKRLNPEVKIMVVSGNHDSVLPLAAFELEADDYIQMPVRPTELWRRVSQCLEGQEIVDLQPMEMAAENPGDCDRTGPQTMLILHDLRGAMVSTASWLKLMARGMYGEMSKSAKAKLHDVNGRIEKMVRLTEDFIGQAMAGDHSVGNGQDVFDLSEDIVRPVLAEMGTEIRDHRIKLVNRLNNKLNGRIPIKGSKLWLKCVFRNLINNGIKYGGRGCTIVIDFETQGSSYRLNVYNTGKTVPEACRSMLFSYSPRPRRAKQCRQGMGLGLPLSRDIIQNQGGDIWYEPKSDGSQFVVSLPQVANLKLLPLFLGRGSSRFGGPWPGSFAEILPAP